MKASDLSVPTNNTNSSTVAKSFSERTPQNPSSNTILRNLVLPRAAIKPQCNETSQVTYSMQDDSITYGIPQRSWMKNLLPEALTTSTVHMDLLTNTTNGTVNDLKTNASIIADLLIAAVATNSTYAPFDAATPFNVNDAPPNNTAWYPGDTINMPTSRLAGLLPPDPASTETQDRDWLLARTTEYLSRATSKNWQNTSSLLRWTLDISRVNITPNVWVDAITIESEVRAMNTSIYGASFASAFGSSTGLQILAADDRSPDAKIHAYAICLNQNGTETLYSTLDRGDPAYTSSVVCQGKSNTSMYVFSSGRHFVADGYGYVSGRQVDIGVAHVRNLRVIYSTTFARISWQLQDLSSVYNANCDVSDGCLGLDAHLPDTKQRLLVNKKALPLDELTVVKHLRIFSNGGVYADPQQPHEMVLVRRPTQVKVQGFGSAPLRGVGFKYSDLNITYRVNTNVERWLGDALLDHNIKWNSTGNKTEWDTYQTQYCNAAYDRRILNYVNNHLYLETTLQSTYTAAAFFLFQNGVAREVLPQATLAKSSSVPLRLDGNIQEMSVWLSVPKLNAMLTLSGCGLLVVALAWAMAKLHAVTGTQDHHVTVTAPHQIARVLVDGTTFPSLLLKRRIHDQEMKGDADQFVIHALAVRQVMDNSPINN